MQVGPDIHPGMLLPEAVQAILRHHSTNMPDMQPVGEELMTAAESSRTLEDLGGWAKCVRLPGAVAAPSGHA